MYSLNVEAPPAAYKIQSDYADILERFEVQRETLTLLLKRFGPRSLADLSTLEDSIEDVLRSWGPIQARIDRFDVFADPISDTGPVIYLSVESPGVNALHRELVGAFGVADDRLEGDAYTPHITLARRGDRTDIAALTGTTLEPIDWTIETVQLWDATYDESITTYSLPV